MPDAYLDWKGDFQVSPSGGLLMVDGDDMVQQRLMRRLCTAVQGYVWHGDYGAGLPQKIGSPWSATGIKAIVTSQIYEEASVAISPPPVINVTAAANVPGLISIDISYTDAVTGTAVSFTITV